MIWILSDTQFPKVPLPTFREFVRRCLCPDCGDAHLDIDGDGNIYCPWCRLLDQAIAAPGPAQGDSPHELP